MKMINKIFCLLSLLALLSSVTSSLAAEQKYPAYQKELHARTKQLIAKANLEAAQEQAKKDAEKTTGAAASVNASNAATQKTSAQNQTPQQSCNCNANTTLNSDPHNFLYSISGERKIRLNPYCKCDAVPNKPSDRIQPVFTQPQTASFPTNNEKTSSPSASSSFNIQY
jgi:hypothetical protein